MRTKGATAAAPPTPVVLSGSQRISVLGQVGPVSSPSPSELLVRFSLKQFAQWISSKGLGVVSVMRATFIWPRMSDDDTVSQVASP
jgi:hypothetical protein